LVVFTDNDDVTESVSAADGRAIPSVVLELEQPLLVRQSRYLAAYQVSAQSHHRPGREGEKKKGKKTTN
jgi:hypothetical protein